MRLNIPVVLLEMLALMLATAIAIVLVQLAMQFVRWMARWRKWLFRQTLALLRACKPFIVSGLLTVVLAIVIWAPILHSIYS